MKKEDKNIYIDSTIKSRSLDNSINANIEGEDKIEEKQPELITIKPKIMSDMINIPGVTILPKKEDKKKSEKSELDKVGEIDPNKCIKISKDIPFIYSFINKESRFHRKINYFETGIENGLTNIYSIKLVNMVNSVKKKGLDEDLTEDENKMAKSNNNNIPNYQSLPKSKYILLLGSSILKSEIYDEQGYKIGKDLITMDYIKISVEENNFNEYEEKMQNIVEFNEPIKIITNYFHTFYTFFKKIKENVIVSLKNVNLQSFFSYILFQELDKKKMNLANVKDLNKVIDKLTFEECFLNIHKYASFVETQIVNLLLSDEEVNNLDIHSVDHGQLILLREFCIIKDIENLESYLKDFLFLEYSSEKVKKYFANDDSKNYIQYVFITKLINKMKNYFLYTFYFCCFERNKLNDPEVKKLKKDKKFSICLLCNCVICEKCINFHLDHKEELIQFDSFEPDPILEKLASGQKNTFRDKIELSFRKKKVYRRKYILLLDYVKILVSEYICKELILIRANEGFPAFIQEAINKQEFKDLFLQSYNINKDEPMLKKLLIDREEDKNPCFKRLQSNFFKIKKKEKFQEGQLFNRKIVEDIAVGIISQGKTSLKFVSKSNLYNEFNTPYMNVYMAHRYSPKMIYRDIFFRKKKVNNFLERYIFPLLNERILTNDIKNDDTNESIHLNLFNKNSRKTDFNEKILSSKVMLINDFNNSINDNRKILNESHLSRITSQGRDYTQNDLEMSRKDSKVRSISNRFSHRKEETESSLFEKILKETSHMENVAKANFPKLKILIAFLEDFTKKIENYGIVLRDEELIIQRNFD
jgi:hypothetical protein